MTSLLKDDVRNFLENIHSESEKPENVESEISDFEPEPEKPKSKKIQKKVQKKIEIPVKNIPTKNNSNTIQKPESSEAPFLNLTTILLIFFGLSIGINFKK